MCPVERKSIEDMAKEAGIHEDDIPHIVDLQMRIYMATGSHLDTNDILVIDLIHLWC